MRRQNDIEEGRLTVTNGGAFSKGAIDVTGISAKQRLVKDEISEFRQESDPRLIQATDLYPVVDGLAFTGTSSRPRS